MTHCDECGRLIADLTYVVIEPFVTREGRLGWVKGCSVECGLALTAAIQWYDAWLRFRRICARQAASA